MTRMLALDTETVGAVRFLGTGEPAPPCPTFKVAKALALGIPRDQLIQLTTLTEIRPCTTPTATTPVSCSSRPSASRSRPRSTISSHPGPTAPSAPQPSHRPSGGLAIASPSCVASSYGPAPSSPPPYSWGRTMKMLATATVGRTTILTPTLHPHHCTLLRRILMQTSILVFHNAPFDLSWLQAWDPLLRRILDGNRPTLVDTGILNALQYERRPERTLKGMAQVHLAMGYDSPFKDGFRFRDAADPDLQAYAAKDSDRTARLAIDLARKLTA